MRILAIDPGSKESAFVIFEDNHGGSYESVEQIIEHGFFNNEDLLVSRVKSRIDIDVLVIESIEGFGMTAGQEIFDTCWWSGRFCQAFRNGNFKRIGRKEIKIHLCGHTRAQDKDVRESLIHRYGQPGKKTSPGKLYGIAGHCWAALAVAVTFSDLYGKPHTR